MNDREALLAAIAASPEDDLPRLAYADWLDEHDDPLGEFIRLQIELEPLKVRRDDPREELERVRLLRRQEKGLRARLPASALPFVPKLDREEELLEAHESAWLGKVARGLKRDHDARFAPELRRGLVASVEIGLSAFCAHGVALRRSCPALQRLTVIGASGRFGPFAAHPALAGLPELLLAAWLTPDDADALADSPHLQRLRTLTVWVGQDERDEAICRSLARLPGLRELTLVQLWGGLDADNPDALDQQADRLANIVNGKRGTAVARVERPFARRSPLDGKWVGYGVDAGHLSGGEPVLVVEGKRPVLIHFDDQGRLLREERLDLSDKLVKPPPFSWEDCDVDELLEVLNREVGFEPGPIFVREFQSRASIVGLVCWNDPPTPAESDDDVESEDGAASVYWWWSTRQFVLSFGNSYWADELGIVHTS